MDGVDPTVREAMTATLEASLAPIGEPLLPPAARARRLGAWLDEQRFQRNVPVPGAPPAAYAHRLLRAPRAPTLLAGIRFKGMDPAQPFVDLLAWDAPLQDPRAMRRALDRVRAAFADFGVDRVRVRWPGERPPPVPKARRAVDQWLVAGRLADLVARGRPFGFEAVEVVRAHDLGFFEPYRQAFARWQAGVGPRGVEVHPELREDLQACLEEGAVVVARAGGAWAGVMAARRTPERAIDGYAVHELFLDETLRGRRRAPVLQRHLIEALPDHGRDCLWGTIHRTNAPSLRTALRCGRRVVETWWFLT
jgi:L-amino acid N-acyltransferase YncA